MESPFQLLARHKLKPKHSWGQNFLADEGALSRIVEALAPAPGELVIELGPGLGHLTRLLAATGAQVVAVERDRDMVAVLEAHPIQGVQVIFGNAATVDFVSVAHASEGLVIGNLPYHLSSAILFQILSQRRFVQRAVFTLQREVVTRISAGPGNRDYGLLSVLLGLFFERENLFTLNANLFYPPPRVDSAVLRLTRLAQPRAALVDEKRFVQLVKAGFAHRRKTLFNSLKSASTLGPPDLLQGALQEAGIDPQRRAETLSPEEFAAIERALGPLPERLPFEGDHS